MKTEDDSKVISKARQLLFAMLAKVSTIDGALEGREAGLVVDLLNFAAGDRIHCLEAFDKARRSRKSLADYAAELVALGLSGGNRREIYDFLWRIAVADGILRATEKYLLRDACTRLGLPSDAFGAAYERHKAAFADEGGRFTRLYGTEGAVTMCWKLQNTPSASSAISSTRRA